MLRPSRRSVLVARDQQARRRIRRHLSRTACASASRCCARSAARVGADFIVGVAHGVRRGLGARPRRDGGRRDRRAARRDAASSTSSTSSAAISTPTKRSPHVIPGMGDAIRAASRFRRRGPRRDAHSDLPRRAHPGRRDRAPRHRKRQARHGRHDARASRRSAYRAQGHRKGASTRSGPASAWAIASTRSIPAQARLHPQRRDRARGDDAACGRDERRAAEVRSSSSAPGPGGLEAARVAGARGHEVVVFEAADRPGGQVLSPPASSGGARSWASSTGASPNAGASASRSAATPTPRRADVAAENPDVVVVATGGVPNIELPRRGRGLGRPRAGTS